MSDNDETKIITYKPLEGLAQLAEGLEKAARTGIQNTNNLLDIHQLLVMAQSLEGYRHIITETAAKCDALNERMNRSELGVAEAYRALVSEFEIGRRRSLIFEADIKAALAGILAAVADVREDEKRITGVHEPVKLPPATDE